MCKVSVVVPIYGVERYIERCARSLFEQTLKDIEYIFVNDCTQDNSMIILNGIIDEYRPTHIKIINHPENKGLPMARKSGIAVASGEYIVNCDSDDWVEKDFCEKLYNKAVETGSDMVVCNYMICDDNGKTPAHYAGDNYSYGGPDTFKYCLSMMLSPAIWIKLVRREILQRSDFIYADYYSSEDWVMTVQCAFYSSKICHLDEYLYDYYVGNETMSRSTQSDTKIRILKQEKANINLICRWLADKKLSCNCWPEIVRRKLWSMDSFVWQMQTEDFKKYYWIWLSSYWTTNLLFLFNKYYSNSEKKRHIKHLLGRI